MTLLPTDSWNVKARPDLPAYELNTVDPVTGETGVLEDHHLWRRSFGKDFREAWWVELEDGRTVPNRVALSNKTHREVTENRARILLDEGTGDFIYTQGRGDEYIEVALNPQPGPPMQQVIGGPEEPWTQAHVHVVGNDEEQCPKCKGRGKVAKPEPKSEHEQAPERKKVTWSVRVPKDEREDGYEVIDTLVEDSVEKLKDANLLKSVNRGANYYALVYVLAFFAQNFKPEVEKA